MRTVVGCGIGGGVVVMVVMVWYGCVQSSVDDTFA